MSNEEKRWITAVILCTIMGALLGAMLSDHRYCRQLRKGVVVSKGVYYTVNRHTDTNVLYDTIKIERDRLLESQATSKGETQ